MSKERGKRIKAIRKKIGDNQKEFGVRLGGLGTSTVSGYETGDVEPKCNALQKIAELGGVTLDWLITGKEPDLPEEQAAPHPLFSSDADNYLGLPSSEACRFEPILYKNDEFYRSIVDIQRQLVELLYSFQLGQINTENTNRLKPQIDSARKVLAELESGLKKLRAKSFKYAEEAEKFAEHSQERAQFIWKRGCKDAGMPGVFDQDAYSVIEHYKQKRLSDAELYENAVRWAKDKLSLIKKVDKRNGNPGS